MNLTTFDFQLYSQEDFFYTQELETDSDGGEMPSRIYWENFRKKKIENLRLFKQKKLGFDLYSESDEFYCSETAESQYQDSYPTRHFWEIEYQQLRNKLISRRMKIESDESNRIGYIILMNLGGDKNPAFMSQLSLHNDIMDFQGGYGLGFDPDKAKQEEYMPKLEQPRREIPYHQDVDIIHMKPCENDITIDNIKLGEAKSDLGHSNFCDDELISTLFHKKDLFENINDFNSIRIKSNPYEQINKAIFLNRAAVKMANLDFLFNLTNTSEFGKKSYSDVEPGHLFYFADICAGPGGFTDYLFWRLDECARGFGMTLSGDHDWASSYRFIKSADIDRHFIRWYGEDKTGNIFNPNNIASFRSLIEDVSQGEMVSLVTADGGVAVDGQENDQEKITKRLVLCQFLCALAILRKGGNFVCKVFDVLTDFNSSLLYIVGQCFEEFCIVKPYTSRPANSERYIVFLNYKDDAASVIDVLSKANDIFQEIDNKKAGDETDIMTLFPIDQIPDYFAEYLRKSNEDLIKKQIIGVDEILIYASDSRFKPYEQNYIANRCLEEWHVPRISKGIFSRKLIYTQSRKNQIENLNEIMKPSKEEIEREQKEKELNKNPFYHLITDIYNQFENKKVQKDVIIKYKHKTPHENKTSGTYFTFA